MFILVPTAADSKTISFGVDVGEQCKKKTVIKWPACNKDPEFASGNF